jgi:RNA-binding protein 25
MNQSPLINEQYNNALNPSSSSSSLSSQQQPQPVTIKKHVPKVKSLSIKPTNQAFADDDEDEEAISQQNKRLRLTSIQLNELEKKQRQQQQQQQQQLAASNLNPEERKKAVKKLVESIPTDREELFNFNIDWEQLDQNLMDKRIKPWVNRKIVEYIGEEEATLNEFICTKILQKVKPDKILDDVKVILDDEAELFVKKMWRLIVYETESKRLGLSK